MQRRLLRVGRPATLGWVLCFQVAVVFAEALDQPSAHFPAVEFDLGPRSVVFERIATPQLAEPAPAPILSPERIAERLLAWRSKRHVTFSLSVTAYSGGAALVRWHHPSGLYEFWSGMDFELLRAVSSFETPDASSSLFFMAETLDRTWVEARNQRMRERGLPVSFLIAWPQVPSGVVTGQTPATWQIVSAPEVGASPEVIDAIENLHAHYNTNRAQIAARAAELEAARLAAQQAQLAAPPPEPKDTLIQFFPIRAGRAPSGREGAP